MTTESPNGSASLDPNLSARLSQESSAALTAWQQSNSSTITLERFLTEGHTEAVVAVVVVQPSSGAPVKVILKACPPHRHTAREPRLHAQALADAPEEFAHGHMVTQAFEPVKTRDNWWLLFQSIAGDSLRQMRPMASLARTTELPVGFSEVVRRVLSEWNPVFRADRGAAHAFLKESLRSKAEGDGPLARISSELGPSWGVSPAALFPSGRLTANPIAWLFKDDLWSGVADLTILRGHVHGDLHPGNVVVPIAPTPDWAKFRLIDFSAYESHAPLSIDPLQLLLSVVVDDLPSKPAQRGELIDLLVEPRSGRLPLHLSGYADLASSVHDATTAWIAAAGRSFTDDWADQWSLGLVAAALELAARSQMAQPDRLWLLELAGRALERYVTEHGGQCPLNGPAQLASGVAPSMAAAEAAAQVLEHTGEFDRSIATVAILSPAFAPRDTALMCSWNVVIDFDSATADSGFYAATALVHQADHLITVDQHPVVGPGQTLWIAARGLNGRPETIPAQGLKGWRARYRTLIVNAIRELGRKTTKPVAVIVFGNATGEVQAAVEATLDEVGERVRVVHVGTDREGLSEYADAHVACDPSEVLSAVRCPDEGQLGGARTIPGVEGPVPLAGDLEAWINDFLECLNSTTGMNADVSDVGEGFYRGRTASWFELGLGVDVPPRVAERLLAQVRPDLRQRDTLRISILHYPGAGGSTLARRVAWEIHSEHPVLYGRSVRDEAAVAERVAAVAKSSGMSVLLVLESTTETVLDRLFAKLRADSVPCVIVSASRRMAAPAQGSERSFYLGVRTANELHELALKFGEYAPSRQLQLHRLAADAGANAVPFFFGLTAFEESYQGLDRYVSESVSNLDEVGRFVVGYLALCHRFAGAGLPASIFASLLQVEPRKRVQLGRYLPPELMALLVEELDATWRTSHWLIAGEVLKQLLAHGPDPESWRRALSSWAVGFIDLVAIAFPELPDPIRNVVDGLFIVRDNREALGGGRSFSELLTQTPEVPGRLEVMRHLTEAFPTEPHYWGHLARLLNYEADDLKGALDAIDHALVLEQDDSVLHHIKGMIYRSHLQRAASAPYGDGDDREVLKWADSALGEFDEAARLDEQGEHAPVATVQLVTTAIEAGFRRSRAVTHSEFLARPTSAKYRQLLERGEEAVERIRELTAEYEMSRFATDALAELRNVYDDYSTLLQGLHNLLSRTDVLKGPVRRRIVRAYAARAGSWESLPRSEVNRSIELLEQNLRDDPADWASLRDWLRLGRLTRASLDRASELVAYWAQQAGSRESLYYDYVLAALRVLDGRHAGLPEALRKLDRCRERTGGFGNRRYSYEWLGKGDGLAMLVSNTELSGWEDRSATAADPKQLRRVAATIHQISSAQAGVLALEGGLHAFFAPGVPGAHRGRDENRRVTCLIGFSYEGIRAWSVQLDG